MQILRQTVPHDAVTFLDEKRIMLTFILDEHITEYTYHKDDGVISVRETIDGEVQEVQITMPQLVELFDMLHRSQLN